MADDKGGGGPEWGALEIVIGILLVIGVLDHLTGRPGFGDAAKTPQTSAPAVVQHARDATCGLSLTRPAQFEVSKGFVTIVGTVGSCNWKLDGDTALYAQVIDGKGKPISSYTKVQPSAIDGTSVSFAASIPFTQPPSTATGYVLFVPAVQPDPMYTLSTRVPIKF